MKTAIYIDDGRTQFVLTPESDIDRKVLDAIEKEQEKLKTYRGGFYQCAGGWTRHNGMVGATWEPAEEKSLIFVIDKKPEQPIHIFPHSVPIYPPNCGVLGHDESCQCVDRGGRAP